MSNYISVVIRCYNEEQHIGRLLSGILQQTVKDVEIIVVDSGSIDATVSIASRYPAKILHIRPEDFSFGRSLNAGCQAASGEFIVIASAHVYPVYSDWLEKLLSPFSDPQVALVYGKQRGNDSTRYSEQQVFTKWFPDDSRQHQDYPFCNNANAAIRRSLWQQMPYDETLTGLEDLDWARCAMELGYRITYAGDAEITHVHNETYRQIYNRYRREAIAMKHICPHEKFSLWDVVRLFTGNVFSDCRHGLYDRALLKNLRGIVAFRFMQFWGTYRGFNQRSPVTNQLRQTFYYPKGWIHSRSQGTELEPRHRIDYSSSATEEKVDGNH